MGLQHHYLQNGADYRSLADWGITSCVVTLALGGEDSMQFTLSAEISDVNLFPLFAVLILHDPYGNVRFAGILTKPARAATGTSQSRTYVVEGYNYYLRRLTYQQQWYFATVPLDFVSGYAEIAADLKSDPSSLNSHFALEWTGQVILNRRADGTVVSIQQEIATAAQQVITAGAPLGYDTSAIPAGVRPPLNQQLDLKVLDVIRAQLAWMPHINCRWEYGAIPHPVLRFGDTVEGGDFSITPVHTLQLTGDNPGRVDWTGNPRWDLLSPGVEITYIYGTLAVDPDDPTTYVRPRGIHRDASPVVSNGAFGIDKSTIVLQGDIVNYGAGQRYLTNGEPVPPDGLAAQLHKAYARLYYEMTFSTQVEEVDWSNGPGERWVVTGATAEFLTAEAVCQSITRDIGTGRTTWQCGPPTQLGLGSRLDLVRAGKLRKPPEDAGALQNGLTKPGDQDPPPKGGGTADLEFLEVKICVGDDSGPVTKQVAFKKGT